MIYNLLINACIGCPVCISLRPSELLYRRHYILIAFSAGFRIFVAHFSAKNNTLISYNTHVLAVPSARSIAVPSVFTVPSVPSCFRWFMDVSFPCTFVPGNETTTQWTFVPGNESVTVLFPGMKLPASRPNFRTLQRSECRKRELNVIN